MKKKENILQDTIFTIIIDTHLNKSLGKLLITASNNCTCFRKGNMELCLEESILLLRLVGNAMLCHTIIFSVGFYLPFCLLLTHRSAGQQQRHHRHVSSRHFHRVGSVGCSPRKHRPLTSLA